MRQNVNIAVVRGVSSFEHVFLIFVRRFCDKNMMCKRKAEDDVLKNPKRPSGHWAMGLLSAMEDPNLQVKSDDKLVVIKDKYPKSEFHYLVLPRLKISKLSDLDKSHLDLLKHMQDVGMQLASNHPTHNFMLGYHAEPSMHHLHLHVISDDFNSLFLKNKKHWNSFTTDHFITSEEIIKEVSRTGKPKLLTSLQCKELLGRDLQCHKCSTKPKNMPQLKAHLLSHLNKK